jgi:hypothetical protein
MKKLFSYIGRIFNDVNGQPSSKRWIAFGLFLLIATITLGVTWFHAHFEPTIWGDLNWALLLFGGLVTSEMFTNRKP